MQIILLFISTLFFGQLGNNYSIHVNVVGCECPERDYFGYLLLSQDNQLIDSVSMRVNKLITISGYYKMRGTAKFRNLRPGNYSISYRNFYEQDSIVNITIGSKKITEIEICHDRINAETFDNQTPLDDLVNGDTLYINSYIASFGEFGGYDEGLWIWKENDELSMAFFQLQNSYHIGFKPRIPFYKQHRNAAQIRTDPHNLSKSQIEIIDRFLIEMNVYPIEPNVWTNAPEFLSIYTRTDSLEREISEIGCNIYSELKRNLTPASRVDGPTSNN